MKENYTKQLQLKESVNEKISPIGKKINKIIGGSAELVLIRY